MDPKFVILWLAIPGTALLAQDEAELDEKIARMYPMPETKSIEQFTDELRHIPDELLPEFVTVNREVKYDLVVKDEVLGQISAFAGHKAKPLKVHQRKVHLTNNRDWTTRAVVDITDTDLPDTVRKNYEAMVTEARERILNLRKEARVSLKEAIGRGERERELLADGRNDPRFAPVVKYLAEGRLESGILKEAKRFIWLGRQRHQGIEYDTALVYFEVETIFGIFPNSMKCLMLQGNVIKWIDSQTGEERD